MQDLHDLEVLVRSAIPLIVIETHEERRVRELFEQLALKLASPLFVWTVTEGLARAGALALEPQTHTREPKEMLGQIKATRSPGIYLIADFHPYLDEPVLVRYLKDIALAHPDVAHTLVLISHELKVPPELERLSAQFELSIPDRGRVRSVVLEEAQTWSQRNYGQNVRTNRRLLDALVENLLGMPEPDVRRLARGAIDDDGAISEDDLPAIMKAKYRLLGGDGVLSFEYDTARFADVGGLDRLKQWLDVRKPVFAGRVNRPGLDVPKGIMLLGVQGCGKSLAAKAVAGAWSVPLLRLDFGTLYNKYHGESERNLRASLTQADVMSPCVLWIDEIEKGIGGDDTADSGTSKRILGTLLTWMAENKNRVFLVATANDIEALPPELLRKGRVDEIFFVDLPDLETREIILGIHLRKRDLDPGLLDVHTVAAAADGFSGAELEQVVVSSLYAGYGSDLRLTTELMLEEVTRTRPLSVVMAERIGALRVWASSRTVAAD
ncbi:MAG: AAA family ATPase [Gammaproteobacteria bacterium]